MTETLFQVREQHPGAHPLRRRRGAGSRAWNIELPLPRSVRDWVAGRDEVVELRRDELHLQLAAHGFTRYVPTPLVSFAGATVPIELSSGEPATCWMHAEVFAAERGEAWALVGALMHEHSHGDLDAELLFLDEARAPEAAVEALAQHTRNALNSALALYRLPASNTSFAVASARICDQLRLRAHLRRVGRG